MCKLPALLFTSFRFSFYHLLPLELAVSYFWEQIYQRRFFFVFFNRTLLAKVLLRVSTMKRKFCYVYKLQGDTRNRLWVYVAERQDFVWTEHRKARYTHRFSLLSPINARPVVNKAAHCASSAHTSRYLMSGWCQITSRGLSDIVN